MPAVASPPWAVGTWAEPAWAANTWGLAEVFVLDLCTTTTQSLMPSRTTASQLAVRSVRGLHSRRTVVAHCEEA